MSEKKSEKLATWTIRPDEKIERLIAEAVRASGHTRSYWIKKCVEKHLAGVLEDELLVQKDAKKNLKRLIREGRNGESTQQGEV